MVRIGIIGGSGLDDPNFISDAQELNIKTPFGETSSTLKLGMVNNVEVVLLARHGRKHTLLPSQVNYRANLWALKEAGCTHILATTACGSLKQEIERGDLVILDQFIDFTRHRKNTFRDEVITEKMHTPMAEPFSAGLRQVLIDSCTELGLRFHPTGTVITIEGPRFSTKAESKMFQAFGADVINMSIATESALAKEIELPYAAIAMSTDYDCWKEDELPVTWEAVLNIFSQNVDKVIKVLVNSIFRLAQAESNLENNRFNSISDLKKVIRTIPNWPKPGVMFRDVTTLIKNPQAFAYVIDQFKQKYQDCNLTKIAGIESRGFIFGAVLAKEMNLPFVLIRKKGKLPAETISQEYALEYGTDKIEIHKDAIEPGDYVLIVDDLLATGGTALAACGLIERLQGTVASLAFVINLPELHGKEKLNEYEIFSLVDFEGE